MLNNNLINLGLESNLTRLAKQSVSFVRKPAINNCVFNSAVKHYLVVGALELHSGGVINLSGKVESCLIKSITQ